MLVSVLMKKAWQYLLDAKSNRMRDIPAGWAGQIDLEVAAAAIADGCAEPRGTPPPQLAARVAFYRRTLELHRTGVSLGEALNMAEAEAQVAAAAEHAPPIATTPVPPAPTPAEALPPAPGAHSRKKKAHA